MDKEQAIDLLDNLIGMIEDNQGNDYDTALRMAIDALKAQLSQQGTTFDTISRQAAIDIFDDYNIAVENGELEAYSRDRKRLCNLPTIQPQSTAGQLNDSAQSTNLIDRQQAIDALDCINGVEEVLRSLPTVQPEPKEGHWIKHETPDGDEQYECSECGVLWEFNDGTPEDNEAYYCPKCGSYNGGGRK